MGVKENRLSLSRRPTGFEHWLNLTFIEGDNKRTDKQEGFRKCKPILIYVVRGLQNKKNKLLDTIAATTGAEAREQQHHQ